MLGFDDYPDIAARLRSILAGEAHQPHTPQDRRRLLPIAPVERALSTAAGARSRLRPRAVRRRLDAGPMAAAQAGQRLRPALLVLRDPGLPRLVRQPPAVRRAGRGPLAGRPGRARAVPGQRELHVLRQGPRRPATARDAAARAGRGRRRRAGPGVLPAAGRDPARAGRGDRDHAGRGCRTSTSPSSTRARRCCAGCAASATPTASSALLDQVRVAGARGRRPVQRHRRVPGRDRATTSRPCATSWSPRGWTSPGVFGYSDEDGTEAATYDGKLDDDEIRARVDHVTALVEELTAQRAEERIGERGRGPRRVRPTTGTSRAAAAHQGPEVDGSTYLVRRGRVGR